MKENENARLLAALGLCVRAGKVIFGAPQVIEALRRGGAKAPQAVLEAADTSPATHKRLSDKCRTYETRLIRLSADGDTLAAALGKTGSLAAVAVTDASLWELVRRQLPTEEHAEESKPKQTQNKNRKDQNDR